MIAFIYKKIYLFAWTFIGIEVIIWCVVIESICLEWNVRGVAQSGSASALGAGCREFESLHPDHLFAPVAHLDRASAF